MIKRNITQNKRPSLRPGSQGQLQMDVRSRARAIRSLGGTRSRPWQSLSAWTRESRTYLSDLDKIDSRRAEIQGSKRTVFDS